MLLKCNAKLVGICFQASSAKPSEGHAIVCSISYVKFVLQRVAIVCSTGGNSLFYR